MSDIDPDLYRSVIELPERLMVMSLTPVEVALCKVLATMAVILAAFIVSLLFVVQGVLQIAGTEQKNTLPNWKPFIETSSWNLQHGKSRQAYVLAILVRACPLILALLMSLGYPVPAQAQMDKEGTFSVEDCAAEDIPRFRGGTARMENDLFAGTDQNYTSGVGFTLVSHDITGRLRTNCLPVPVRLHAQLIQYLNPEFWANADKQTSTQNVVAKFGQSMYTPEDHSRTDLITDDRPYAGLLYVGLAWNLRRQNAKTVKAMEILDTREITVGVIGPWSLAEQSQNVVHDAWDSDRFLGWEHQLENEPAFQMALDRKYKINRGPGAIIPGFSADAIRSAGLRLGNIETSATLGIEGRVGWNLPNDFGSYPIRPGAENRPPSANSLNAESNNTSPSGSPPRVGVHAFGTLEAKTVAWDFSLDGNLFNASHSVTRRPWVAQAAVGVSMQGILSGRGYKLAIMRVYRTREFEKQNTHQVYGSIALSVDF